MSDRVIDRVKVLDFGIAKLKEAHLEDSKAHPLAHMTLTGTGMVIGTPAYMSPEQAKGLRGVELDGRSDLYSLGVVTYQMLTGDLPLKADSTLDLLMAHISTPPKPILDARPDLNIPYSVAAVVMRCLEKNRELRPASGQALIDEIEVAADRGSVLPVEPAAAPTPKHVAPSLVGEFPASPAIARQNGAPHSRSWRWPVTAVLIAVALGGAWYLGRRKPAAGQQSPSVVATSTEAKPVAPLAVERLGPAPARQPPPTSQSGPNSAASQEPVRFKGSEDATKPAKPASTRMPNGPTSGASQASASSINAPDVAVKPSEPTSTAEQQRQTGATNVVIAVPQDLAPEASTPAPTAIAVSPSPDGALIVEGPPVPATSSELEATRSFDEARAALSARKWEEAATLFGRAARLKPGWSDPFAWKARADIKLARFRDTIEDCDEALKLNPNDATVLNFRGFARYTLNQLDEAISDFNSAIRINPDYPDAYSNRGNARWMLRDKEGAKRDFDTAARLKSTKR